MFLTTMTPPYEVLLQELNRYKIESLPELVPIRPTESWGALESELTFGGAKRRKTKKNTKKPKLTYDHRCCMCDKPVDLDDRVNALVPKQCLNKYGRMAAHRICKECWFEPETGFAVEGAVHKCPGCVHALPLNKKPRSPVDPRLPVEEIE